MLGTTSSNACPAGSVRISSVVACRAAAVAAALTYSGITTSSPTYYPRGCYIYTTVYFNPDAVGGTTYGRPLCQSGTAAPSLPGSTISPTFAPNAVDAAGTVRRCSKATLSPLVPIVGVRVCRAICARRDLEQRVPRRVCANQLVRSVSSGGCGCGTHVLWHHHHQPNELPTRVLRVYHGVL